MVSVNFFTVPTIRFQVLYVFLVLAHDRRRTLHFGVTAHPTSEWAAQQLRGPSRGRLPRYLLRDRDKIFGEGFPPTGSGQEESPLVPIWTVLFNRPKTIQTTPRLLCLLLQSARSIGSTPNRSVGETHLTSLSGAGMESDTLAW